MTESLAPLTVEVVARLGPTVLDVRAADRRSGYRIGEGPRAVVPVAVVGAEADGCVALVEIRADGPWIVVPLGAHGELRSGGACEALTAGSAVKLSLGRCAIVQVGPVSFEVRAIVAEPAPAFRPHFDAPAWLAQAASLALFATLALLVRFTAPESAPPRWDDPELQERLIRYTASLPSPEPSAPRLHRESHPHGHAPAQRVAATPAPPERQESEVGGDPLPGWSRGQDATDMARESGVLGVDGFNEAVARFTASLAESGRHYVRSVADDEAWAAAARAVPRAIELAATLRGGGGEARDVVDVPVTLLSKVDASGTRRWAGQGRKESAFASAAVAVREAPRQDREWTSSIGHDLIRGVVRRNSPEVRRCLREGIERDPSLPGKIEVAFTIETGGRVRTVEIAAGSSRDAEVQRCVAAAVKAWTFPTIVAAAGDVAVRYPFSIG